MIIRSWGATATAEGADRYQAHFTEAVLPSLRRLNGFKGAYVLRQVATGDRAVLKDLTFWDSLDAIQAFSGPDLSKAIVDPAARTFLLDYDATVSHYVIEVDTLSR